jgi:hypothetical protein
MKAKACRIVRQQEKRIHRALMADTAMPTQERLQQSQGAFQIGGDKRSGKIFRMFDTPLQRIFSEQKISELQYEALRQLHTHWFLGQLAGIPRSVDLNRIAVDWNGSAASERELMHREAFDIGWRALERLERFAVNVVILIEQPLTVAGHEIGYRSPYRARLAALELLQSAAGKLVIAWRI